MDVSFVQEARMQEQIDDGVLVVGEIQRTCQVAAYDLPGLFAVEGSSWVLL